MTDLTNTKAMMISMLVGMHFRPPAKAILECLPAGTVFRLEAEPDNPYDGNAIKVLVNVNESVPANQWPELAVRSAGFGVDEEALRAQGEWFLGYVAASDGKPLQGTDYVGTLEVLPVLSACGHRATLSFDIAGKPLLVIVVPKEQVEADAETEADA